MSFPNIKISIYSLKVCYNYFCFTFLDEVGPNLLVGERGSESLRRQDLHLGKIELIKGISDSHLVEIYLAATS